eukprot:02261.XXX_4252_2358_1 [CDS] Oithona nana genome sequencing.
MSIQEENFKICGLCSQLVDESVVNNETLRSFLGELLNVTEDSLPTKTCLECYKAANESKRFKDACLKSINKLQSSKVASSMILGSKGVTLNTKPAAKPTPPPKKAPAPATESSKKKKILESLGLDPDQIEIDVTSGRSTRTRGATESSTSNATPPARASRSKGAATPATPVTPSRSSRSAGAASTTPAKPASASKPTRGRANSRTTQKDSRVQECRIMIKKIERLRADRHFNKHGVVRNSAAGTRKRGADVLSPPPVAPAPAKRLRKGYAYEPVVPVAEEPSKSSPGKDRSSFGRVRNSKTRNNDYVYDTAEAEAAEAAENSPLSKVSKGRKKATPAKKVEEPVEDDTEEVFPTIGPYQCEICQMITDTKVDFVAHIKAKHRDVVDDEVLLSLESDIRKSNKKKGNSKATPAPPPPKKASPKKTPGPASKKAKPTPKAKPKPASKKAAPAKPKPKPASKTAAKVAEVNVAEVNSRDKRNE